MISLVTMFIGSAAAQEAWTPCATVGMTTFSDNDLRDNVVDSLLMDGRITTVELVPRDAMPDPEEWDFEVLFLHVESGLFSGITSPEIVVRNWSNATEAFVGRGGKLILPAPSGDIRSGLKFGMVEIHPLRGRTSSSAQAVSMLRQAATHALFDGAGQVDCGDEPFGSCRSYAGGSLELSDSAEVLATWSDGYPAIVATDEAVSFNTTSFSDATGQTWSWNAESDMATLFVNAIHFLAPSCQMDTDDDGLTDAEEYQLDTDSNNPDMDGDGLSDGLEVRDLGTDPNLADTDQDGVIDPDDNCPLTYNPSQSDADGDGVGTACDDDEPMDADTDVDPDTELSISRACDHSGSAPIPLALLAVPLFLYRRRSGSGWITV